MVLASSSSMWRRSIGSIGNMWVDPGGDGALRGATVRCSAPVWPERCQWIRSKHVRIAGYRMCCLALLQATTSHAAQTSRHGTIRTSRPNITTLFTAHFTHTHASLLPPLSLKCVKKQLKSISQKKETHPFIIIFVIAIKPDFFLLQGHAYM